MRCADFPTRAHESDTTVSAGIRNLLRKRHTSMRLDSKYLGAFLLAITLLSAIAGIGCSVHHHYRIYDPYYTDYHVWNSDEIVYYRQWSNESRRDATRDFRRLPAEEQKEYWTWRHNHDSHDRDRNRDHRDRDER